jgi:hypothetical protein
MLTGLLDHFDAVADHHEVIASANGLLNGLLKRHLIQNGAHVEIVGHSETVEGVLMAEQLGHDVVAEAGGPAASIRIVGGVVAVAGHHAVEFWQQRGVGQQFALFHLLAAFRDHWQELMWVALGGAVAGEVLAAAQDAFLAHGAVEDARVGDDLLRIFAVGAAFERVVRRIVIADVQNRAEVEIETEVTQNLSGEFAMTLDQFGIALVSQRLGIRRLLADQTQSRNAAAFLVDGDERLDVRDVAQVVDEFAELLRRLNVPSEQNKTTRLEFFEPGGGFRGEFRAGDAHEKKLAEGE